MARNFQIIIVTVFLCIAFLCIAGVIFPKYFIPRDLKKSAVLNSSMVSLKLISEEHFASNETIIGNSTDSSSFANRGGENTQPSSFLPRIGYDRLQNSTKRKRFKRQMTSQDDSKLFSWNFKLNVSRLERNAMHEGTKHDPETRDEKNLAVYIESPGAKETGFSELQRAFGSVVSFLKDIFDSDSEKGTNDFKGVNEVVAESLEKKSWKDELDIAGTQNVNIKNDSEKGSKQPETIFENQITQSIQEVSPVSELKTTQIFDSQKLDGESRNESVKKGREGRIFFNIFGLGGKLLGKTSSVSETEATKSLVDVTQTETNIFRDENLRDHALQQKSDLVTENSHWKADFSSDSLKSSVELVKELTNSHSTKNLPSQQTTQLLECSDCVTGDLVFSIFPNKLKEESEDVTFEATDSTEILFTNEILEKFCKNLPNGLDESHLTLFNEESKTGDLTENPFLISSISTPKLVQEDKQRFFSIFDSGSGRSDITSREKDQTSFGKRDEFGIFPSIQDCIIFFSKNRNTETFPKPSDINEPENKIILNFENSSEAANLEQQLQSSSNLTRSVQTFEISEGTETKTSVGNENGFTVKGFFKEHEEIKTESNNFNLDNKLKITENTDTENGTEKTPDDRRDGKFLNFFGLGSGSDVQENSMSVRFFNSFFSSGARSLENFDGSEESDETTDLGSGDAFLSIEGFSGDDTLLPASDSDPSSGQEHRFLNLLGFAGSGNGRELTENSELIITESTDHTDYECDNCSRSIAEQTHKCYDYECNFGNNHDSENIDNAESVTPLPFNESDCHGDCYPSTELLNSNKSSTSTSESSNHDDKNITEYFHKKSEDCKCFRENNFTGENEVYPKCDCISDILQVSNVAYIAPGSNFSTETPLSKNPFEENEYENSHENIHDEIAMPVTATLLKTSELIYQFTTDRGIDQETESLLRLKEVSNTDYLDFTTLSSDSINIEDLHKETTAMKPRRFMGTIFLTGSGEGGLFGDDNGPINLVEEENTINPVVHSRRRGRLNDLSDDPCDDCVDPSELIQKSGMERPRTNSPANDISNSPTNKSDDVPGFPENGYKAKETTLEDSIISTENITFRPVTVLSRPSSSPNAPPDLQPRPCIGARDCNATLGERCITVGSSSVCECGRTYVRQKLTRKCVARRQIETTLKLPQETFDSDLRDPESARYKVMSKKSVDTMWLLLSKTPDVNRIVAEVNVAKFISGSLIISLNLVLAVENESEVESLKGIEDILQKALGDEKLMKKASLNIKNATVLSVFREFDPCKSAELNYCNKNAYCVKEDNRRGYNCYCKEHFLDASSDPLFPGETCIAMCPPSYCGPHGHCEILENERHCLCSGMYFGERCEVPGMVILCSLSVAAIVSVVVLCAVILRLRCRRTSYGGSPTFRRSEQVDPNSIAASRVSDAIALATNPDAQVLKFAQINSTSAPVPPIIKVIKPTLNDSSNLSFECDSSFDVTQMSEQAGSTEN